MRQIAIYGKGGIGKSTTSANISASLAHKGLKVLQIGCDPKHDSTRTLVGRFIPTVLDVWRTAQSTGKPVEKPDIVFSGYRGVDCIEAGGPEPGIGCAGRGIIRTMEILEDLGILDDDYDMTLFDVLGDVVCGGFAKPIQSGYSKEIYIVSSGEFMSLYAANNIAIAVEKVGKSRGVKLGGIICNSRALALEYDLVDEFALRINSRLIHCIPRSPLVQSSERHAKTVIEYAPESGIAEEYSSLTDKIYNNTDHRVPTPLHFEELIKLSEQYNVEEV